MNPYELYDEWVTTYGIIGDPIEHSLSPLMHNAAFRALEVEATYKKFHVLPDGLDEFFEGVRQESSPIFGFNVTVPHKEAVLKYMDALDPFAEKVQAVNTVVISPDRKLSGYNTDGPGFMAHLAELDFNVADKRIAIMGAGGTTRAILTALCLVPNRPKSIRIYNRTFEKLESLLVDLKERINIDIVEPVMAVDDLNIELADLLINTTSVGLREEDPCLVDENMLNANLLVYDVIYKKGGTPLLQLARDRGASTANGLGMLFYQGVLAFQHWANMELSDDIKQVMRDALGEVNG